MNNGEDIFIAALQADLNCSRRIHSHFLLPTIQLYVKIKSTTLDIVVVELHQLGQNDKLALHQGEK